MSITFAESQQEIAAFIKMNDWVALRGKKQLPEKIGLTTRTTKTTAQRAAPKEAATRAAKEAKGREKTPLRGLLRSVPRKGVVLERVCA